MFYSKLDSLYSGNHFLMDCQLIAARTKLDCISTYNQYQRSAEKKMPLRFSSSLELIKELHHALNQNDQNAYNINLSSLQNMDVYHHRKSHLYKVISYYRYPLEVINPNYIDKVELMYLKREEARLDYRLNKGDVSKEGLSNLYKLEEQNLCSAGRDTLIKSEIDKTRHKGKNSNKVTYYIYQDIVKENEPENISDNENTFFKNPISKILSDPLANYEDSFLNKTLVTQSELFNEVFKTLNDNDEYAYNLSLLSIENEKLLDERIAYLDNVLKEYKSHLKKIPNVIIRTYIKRPYIQREKARSIFREVKGEVPEVQLRKLFDLEIENRSNSGRQILLNFEMKKLKNDKSIQNNNTSIYFINEKDIEIIDEDKAYNSVKLTTKDNTERKDTFKDSYEMNR